MPQPNVQLSSGTPQPQSIIVQQSGLTAEMIARSKIGDGLSMASAITGIIAMVFSFFSGLFLMSYNPNSILLVAMSVLPMAIAAMITGIIGARMQRIISQKFGLGITGAVLGLIALIIVLMGLLLGSIYHDPYYGFLGL